jgi:hypothetical protein
MSGQAALAPCPKLAKKAHLVFNSPKFLLIDPVGPRPSQVVRSTPLGVRFPDLQEYISRPVPVCACRRVFSFSSKAATYTVPPGCPPVVRLPGTFPVYSSGRSFYQVGLKIWTKYLGSNLPTAISRSFKESQY